VTSSNAVKIIAQLPAEVPIFFIPDVNLGRYVASKLGRKMDFFPSCCPIHDAVTPETILQRKAEHPDAVVLVHPECTPEVINLADYVGSTAGMVAYAAQSPQPKLIIGTECGIMHKIEQLNPDKELILADPELVCIDMKMITLEKILHSLETMETKIVVPEDIRVKAAQALEKMIEMTA
jgi:quinolinate synthase